MEMRGPVFCSYAKMEPPLCFLENEKVQKQQGASVCGLFALAFAAD